MQVPWGEEEWTGGWDWSHEEGWESALVSGCQQISPLNEWSILQRKLGLVIKELKVFLAQKQKLKHLTGAGLGLAQLVPLGITGAHREVAGFMCCASTWCQHQPSRYKKHVAPASFHLPNLTNSASWSPCYEELCRKGDSRKHRFSLAKVKKHTPVTCTLKQYTLTCPRKQVYLMHVTLYLLKIRDNLEVP